MNLAAAFRSRSAWPTVTILSLWLLLPLPEARATDDASLSELPSSIREILESRPIRESRSAVLVRELETGKEVFARNADELLNPASNMKLLTSVTALSLLGPSHRFPTEFYVSKPPRSGVVQGSLYMRGLGDPSIDTERLFRIVRDLRFKGIREITGNLVIDDTYFDAEYEGPGWEQDDSDRPYMAGAGAVSLNYNSVGIHVHPGETSGSKARIELDPPSDYLVLQNLGMTRSPRSRTRIVASSIPEGNRQRIMVRASIPQGSDGHLIYRRISNPPRYTGETLRAMLIEQGVKVRGKVVLGKVPEDLTPIYVSWSDPLSVLVHTVNKWSQNHMSEMLIKALGAIELGEPGTWAKGIQVMEDFLATEVGIPRGSMVLRNGSGLNDTNRVSARQLVRLLEWVDSESRIAPELWASLPIAGVDGTTRNRLGDTLAEGRIRAKTGTLQNVTALSGIASSVGGTRYAFAILVNDYPGSVATVLPGVDAIGAAIASVGSVGGSRSAIALASPPPADPSTPIDILRTRVATFAELGRGKDAKNATFLRSAMRSERDPALRAVIAEALVRADPEDSLATEAFLGAFDASDAVFGRLRTALRGSALEMPLLNTLFDLGAAGSRDAIDHLLAVAARLDEGDQLGVELSAGLAEVGRTAPDELLASLDEAEEAAQLAAIRLLRDRIGTPDPRLELAPTAPHPFSITLAKAAESGDTRLATFARSVEDRLGMAPEPLEPSQQSTPASIAP